MSDIRIFVDTNVLVYAYGRTDSSKHSIAVDIVEGLWRSRLGVLSTQVLQEFFVTVTKKVPAPLDPRQAGEIVQDLLKWEVVINNGESILRAIDIHCRRKLSFWDAMIIGAAVRSGARQLLSEDLQDGLEIEGVVVRNPFAAGA